MENLLCPGKLLAADPSIIGDVSFTRAVILLVEYDSGGTIGFILNKPILYDLNTFVPEIGVAFPVFQGGPVEQDRLYFIHKRPDLIPESKPVTGGFYWGGRFACVTEKINNGELTPNDIKFFLGYSGWDANQLEKEISNKTWIVFDQTNDKELTSTADASYWKSKMITLGGDYKLWANAPSHPHLN